MNLINEMREFIHSKNEADASDQRGLQLTLAKIEGAGMAYAAVLGKLDALEHERNEYLAEMFLGDDDEEDECDGGGEAIQCDTDQPAPAVPSEEGSSEGGAEPAANAEASPVTDSDAD